MRVRVGRVVAVDGFEGGFRAKFEVDGGRGRLRATIPLGRGSRKDRAVLRCIWERYVGPAGAIIGVNRFGVSAPGQEVMRKFGFTPEHVVEAAKAVLSTKRSE